MAGRYACPSRFYRLRKAVLERRVVRLLRIAVVEDDPSALAQIEQFLSQYQADRGVAAAVSLFRDGSEILADYRPVYDIIFLDIEMPGVDGMSTAERIRQTDQNVVIVFITNMAQYAIRGYEVNAVDFMLKPVSYFNFAEKLERALRFSRRRGWRNILLSGEDGVVRFPASELQYVEKDRDYLLYHTDGGVYCKRGTMKSVREELAGLPFEECTVGCLVNLERVRRIWKESVYLQDAQLPLSRRLKKKFTQSYIDYVGGGL